MVRSAAQLADVEQPAWAGICAQLPHAPYPVQALAVDRDQAERVLERLQVTARSVLGALALESGGLLIDHAWLRILGGGSEGLPDLAAANELGEVSKFASPPGLLIVGWDVLGGRFAIDGGVLGLDPGQVCYFAPDTLAWESLGVGHSAFVSDMIGGAATQFYEGARWPGWEEDCAALQLDHGFSLWPPPFSAEGKDAATVSRRAVPMVELFRFYDDAGQQLSRRR